MHHHHADMFNGIEAGARFAEYAQMLVDGGGGGGTTTRTNSPTSADAAERQAQADAKKADEKPKPTPVEQAKEAIKDGKISSNEAKVVKTGPVKEAIKGQKETLREAVKKAEGGDEHWRDGDGKLVLEDGKAVPTGWSAYPDTEHEERVADLTDSKDKHGLEAIDRNIDRLKDAGVDTSALERQRDTRVAEEKKVVEVIEQKESLVGALEAEKAELEAGGPEEDPYAKMTTDAAKWLVQFNENGGQSHTGNDWFFGAGDGWDNEDGDISLDQLMGDLEDDDRRADFARVQGKGDDDGGDTDAEMQEHIADVMADDPEEGTRIALRYQAAQELTKIADEYFSAKDAAEGNEEAIAQIDAEIGILNESIETDRAALSEETLDAMAEANEADTDIIPNETETETETTSNESGSPDDRDETGGSGDGGSGETEGSGDGGSGETEGSGSGNGSGTGDTEGSGNGGDGGTEGTGETEGGQGGTTENEQPTTREVEIDYNTPERREEVLTQARERNLVPAENTTFDEQGQAVYNVQRGDSYWRIADMSDGQPPHQFDYGHFEQTVRSNSERFGRDASTGLIHPNESVIIPGRSVQELVALMGLPTTETVEVEPEETHHGGGGRGPLRY